MTYYRCCNVSTCSNIQLKHMESLPFQSSHHGIDVGLSSAPCITYGGKGVHCFPVHHIGILKNSSEIGRILVTGYEYSHASLRSVNICVFDELPRNTNRSNFFLSKLIILKKLVYS